MTERSRPPHGCRSSPPLSTAAWYGDRLLDLRLPAHWEVTVHLPSTPDRSPTTRSVRRSANPVGQSELATLAAGRRRVAIVVDDLTRPTPVDRILPHVLDELARGRRPGRARSRC